MPARFAILSLSQLVTLYNTAADKPIKGFGTKPIALDRVAKLAKEKGLHFNGSKEAPAFVTAATTAAQAEAVTTKVREQVAKVPAKKHPEVSEARRPRKAKAEKVAAQRSEYAEAAKITVVEKPAAREGSHRAARYGKLHTGMTVGQYLTAAHKANGERRPRHRYHADIRRLVEAGSIKVEG